MIAVLLFCSDGGYTLYILQYLHNLSDSAVRSYESLGEKWTVISHWRIHKQWHALYYKKYNIF